MKKEFDKLGRWIPIKKRSVIRNGFLALEDITFRLPNGEVQEHYYVAEKPSVVVIIPVRDNKTFLIREYERGVTEVGHKFPGGRIDKGEMPDIAAGREFEEELGLKPKRLISLGETYVDPGFMTARVHYFLATDFEEVPEKRIDDPRELFEGHWVELSQVASGIHDNTIKNPFVIVGYSLVTNYLAQNSTG